MGVVGDNHWQIDNISLRHSDTKSGPLFSGESETRL